ncbi:hypothetical protein RQP46_010078 [Phenoliferia psychrophenolica]
MFGLASRLFGQDPKLEFRKPGAGVNLLAGPVIAPDDAYWSQFWLLFDSPTDVITLLDSTTLSLALHRQPTNLSTLVTVLASHLSHLLSLPDFPHSPPSSPLEDLAKEALNCVRVLSRVVPVVVRPTAHLENSLFWTSERVKVEKAPAVPTKEGVQETGQFVIDDEDEDEPAVVAEGKDDETGKGEDEDEWENLPTLAERLITALVDLCFVPGFTVPEESRTGDGAIAYVIWEPGIAAPPTSLPPTPPSHLASRLEVLRLLNLLLSLPSLLTPPHLFPTIPNPWRDSLVSGRTLERKVVLCLLCSLLNTAFAPSLSSASGLLVGGFEKIAGVAMRREDVRGLLTGSCLQLLEILFSEHAEPPPPPSTSTPTSPNAFTHYLSKLHRKSDLDLVLGGILGLLQQSLSQPLLPVVGPSTGQKGKGGWANEAIVVLWRITELNPKFLNHVLEGGEHHAAADLVVYLLTLCLEHKDDETQMGLVRLSAFFLQSLTASPLIGASLNLPVDLKLGSTISKYAVPGTLADFLIVSIYTLIFTTKAKLASLYPAFVLAIANASPYLQNVSALGATRLVQLFLAFSAPSFLLMEEGNPRLVFYLLETFNNVIHYQLSDNPHLIYSLIRSHQRFQDLSTFTLASGVSSVRRARLERKQAIAEQKAEAERVVAGGGAGGEGGVSSWREGLPLDSIHILLSEFSSKVLSLSPDPSSSTTPVIAFLSSASLSGLLPPPPPLHPRRRWRRSPSSPLSMDPPPAPMALDLPEVFEDVLQYLPTASLVACTLVCHSWRSSTLPTLLRTIKLRHPYSATALLRTLSAYPEWQTYVRKLDITSGPSFRKDVVTNDQLLAISRLCPRVTSLVLRKLSTDVTDVLPEIFGSLSELRSLVLSVTTDSWHQQLQVSLSEILIHTPNLQELSLNAVVFSRPPPGVLADHPAPSLRKLHLFAVRVQESEILWLLKHSRETLTSLRLVDVDFPRLIAVHSYGTTIISVLSTSSTLFSIDGVAEALDLLNERMEHLVLGLNSRLLDRQTTTSTLSRIKEIDLFLLPHLSRDTVRDAIDAFARCRIPKGTRIIVVIGHGAQMLYPERNLMKRISPDAAMVLAEPLPFDINKVVGSLVAGSWLNSGLYALELAQAWAYFRTYCDDPSWTKALVAFVLVVDGAATIAAYALTYMDSVLYWVIVSGLSPARQSKSKIATAALMFIMLMGFGGCAGITAVTVKYPSALERNRIRVPAM